MLSPGFLLLRETPLCSPPTRYVTTTKEVRRNLELFKTLARARNLPEMALSCREDEHVLRPREP